MIYLDLIGDGVTDNRETLRAEWLRIANCSFSDAPKSESARVPDSARYWDVVNCSFTHISPGTPVK